MLRTRIIEPAHSFWALPVLFIPKLDRSWICCIEYRNLHEAMVKDVYPAPQMDEYIHSVGSENVFTALNATWCY